MTPRFKYAPIVLTAMLVTACVTAPPAIRNAPPGPGLVKVQVAPDQHVGQSVRWGGVIVALENKADHTVIQIVARPLYDSGRPLDTSNSPGRFLAKANGFIEPTEYKKGREITVVGTVAGIQVQPIGEHPYSFPLITINHMYLWEPRYEPGPYYAGYPYYWDPFYRDPFYPWGFGYYHFRYHGHHHHNRGHKHSGHRHGGGGHKHGTSGGKQKK